MEIRFGTVQLHSHNGPTYYILYGKSNNSVHLLVSLHFVLLVRKYGGQYGDTLYCVHVQCTHPINYLPYNCFLNISDPESNFFLLLSR